MQALYFRYHSLIKEDCHDLEEGRAILTILEDNGEGMSVGVYDPEQKVLYLDGFDNIIGADPSEVQSRVLRDLKASGIKPDKIESLNPRTATEL